jgi:methylenetetrahydrofolate--tRNA-(uracil-5-)-methyltransferase
VRWLNDHPNIEIVRERIDALPASGMTIVATGPLTAGLRWRRASATATGHAARLAFFDAIAPIGPGGGEGKDYINCPMDKAQYLEAFVQGLLDGQKTEFKEWEGTPYFDGCLPIEVMAERGPETLRHGPMKPMGLTNAHNRPSRPMRSCSCGRTMRWARSTTWSASRPS